MDTRFLRTTLTLLAVLTLAAPAAAAWNAFDGGAAAAPRIDAREAGAGRTVVEITLPGIETETMLIDGQPHTKVVLPGHVQLLDRGAPQLPYITTSLVIPDQGTPELRLVKTRYRELPVERIVPGRGAILRTVDPATVPYTYGPAYQGGVFPAEPASVGEPYIVRDVRGVNVRLFPAQWDADRGVLRVLESVTYEVVTAGSGGVNIKTRQGTGIAPVFDALYAQKFANYQAGLKYEMNAGDGPMLIVAYDAFAASMQPFVDWKRQRGIPVELITTSSVGGTTSGIQAAIQERYDSAAGLAFVILVGDGQQVPHYSGAYEGANDDTRYMRLDGSDVYPDALISRISAQNATEVSTQVTKFVTYERDVMGAADWTHQGTGIASNEGSPSDITRMDWLRDDLLAYNYTDVDRIYQGQGGSTGAIAAAVNEGRSLINYMGHGSGTSWSSVYFNNSDVGALTNTDWPWIIDVACLNGGISAIGTSFAEAWMRAGNPEQPHGAVGMYASSTSCPWVPPTLMQAEAVDLLCAETSNVMGVLVQAGIMAVLDEYGTSGTGLQLIEQYNLFGDCSLVVRSDSPQTLAMDHLPVVPLQTPTFPVETGLPGVRVALTAADGTIHGVGQTDATGFVDLQITEPVAEPGTVVLTASGYNVETYQAELQAVVPADIAISPATVPVGETTAVTVTVTDPDTGDGMADVTVEIAGFGVETTGVGTDAAGQATLEITPQFGENLTVRGRELGAGYDLFTEPLPVTGAMAFGGATITAAVPAIGLDGSLTPYLEGEITVATRQSGYTLEVHGAGIEMVQADNSGDTTVLVTPQALAPVMATLTVPGLEIVQQELAVVEAFGTLAGTVLDGDDDGAAVAGARVLGFAADAGPDDPPLFDLTTDASGAWAAPEELAVGYYDLVVQKFGYEPYTETYFLLFGANDHPITVNQAPSGVLTGVITGADDGAPLDATVRVYRTDNDELYDEVVTDPATGEYVTGGLPFFDYRVVVRAYRRIPVTETVSVTEATVTRDYALEATEGDILVLDDNSSQARQIPAKFADDGRLLAPAYTAPADRAASDLVAALEDLGYTATLQPASSSDPDFWADYDLIICSSGANTSTLTSGALRANLTAHVAAGGRLLVEGGEVAYDMQYTDATFMRNVLHVDDWNGDSSGDVSVADAAHPVMSVPNVITGPIDNAYSGYGDADRVDPTSTGHLVGNWTSYPGDASVIIHDDDDDPAGGPFVFFLFNYGAMGPEREGLLHNAVSWLLYNPLDPTPVTDQPEAVPSVLALAGNYPNPFNPMTVIRFSLPATQQAELAVFDVRGKRVRTLVHDVLPAGAHEITWQGRDDQGRSVASGTYFSRLTAGGESLVQKMLLIK